MAHKWKRDVQGFQHLMAHGCHLSVEREASGPNGVSWYTSCGNRLHCDSGGADTVSEGKKLALQAARRCSRRR